MVFIQSKAEHPCRQQNENDFLLHREVFSVSAKWASGSVLENDAGSEFGVNMIRDKLEMEQIETSHY